MNFHLGRNYLTGTGWNIGSIQRNQNKIVKKIPGFRIDTSVYPNGHNDLNFIKDLFSAVTYAVWLTDQEYNTNHSGQVGLISEYNGFSPADISTLRPQSDGRIFNFRGPKSSEYDLTVVLKNNPQGPDATILGPDGLFGNDADSVLAEVARTGKMFGKTIPQAAKPLFDRLGRGVSTTSIEQAKSARAKNPNQRSNTKSAGYEPSTLSGDAQLAMGFDVTKPLRSIGQTWGKFNPSLAKRLRVFSIPFLGGAKGGGSKTPPSGVILPPIHGGWSKTPPSGVIFPPKPQPTPPNDKKGKEKSEVADDKDKVKEKAKDEDTEEGSNLGLILGISAGVLVLGGVAVVIAKKKKKKAI